MKHNRRAVLKGAGIIALASTSSSNYSLAHTTTNFDKIPRIQLTNLPTACNCYLNSNDQLIFL